MEQTILTRQNEERNINRLCAQKQLYIGAKKIFLTQIILTVPLTIVLALIKLVLLLWFKIDISVYVIFYGISVTLIDLLLINPIITQKKKNGAKVQELFDCSVYDLEWNGIFVGKKPEPEIVSKNNRLFRASNGDVSRLIDWYPQEIGRQPALKAIALCQKSNLNYDSALRKSFVIWTMISAFCTLAILVLFGLVQNYSLKDFLAQLAVSFLPIFVLAVKIVLEQRKTLKSSEELKGSIDNVLEKESLPTLKQLRCVQDRIYSNRKDSALIPEFFYNFAMV